jgi:hypothetical protein
VAFYRIQRIGGDERICWSKHDGSAGPCALAVSRLLEAKRKRAAAVGSAETLGEKKGASAGRASSAVSWGSATRSAEGGGYHRLRIVKEYSMGEAGTWSACERDSGKWREGRWLDSGDRPGEDGGALVVEDCSQHQQEEK